MKKIIAVNAGPRTGWNTDQLIKSVAKGASDVSGKAKARREKYYLTKK